MDRAKRPQLRGSRYRRHAALDAGHIQHPRGLYSSGAPTTPNRSGSHMAGGSALDLSDDRRSTRVLLAHALERHFMAAPPHPTPSASRLQALKAGEKRNSALMRAVVSASPAM